MKGSGLDPHAGPVPAQTPPGLGDVRDPLIVRTGLAPSLAAMPILVRPNDPLVAADVRAMAHEIILECLQAGSAEIVSEVAMPLQAHALALLLNLSTDHADEWISWGHEGLDYDAGLVPGARPCVTDYVDRQLINARRSHAYDFFAALDRVAVAGQRLDFDTRRQVATHLLSAGRARVVATVAGALEWLAAEPRSLGRLRADYRFAQRSVDSLLGALPDAAGDAPLPPSFVRQHAGLLLRAVFAVVAARVERLTVIRRQPCPDAHSLEWHALLVAFMPREDAG